MQGILMITGWGVGTAPLMPLQQHLVQHGYQVELINIFNVFDPALLSQHLKLVEKFDVILGWSLGGQIATYLVDQLYHHTGQLKTLITLASNPRFISTADWPMGMAHSAFSSLKESFDKNPVITLKRFYYLVTQGSQTAKQDWQTLQSAIQSDDFLLQAYALDMWGKMNGVDTLKHYLGQQLHIFSEADGLIPHKIIDAFKGLNAKSLTWDVVNGAHGFSLFDAKPMSEKIVQYLKNTAKNS